MSYKKVLYDEIMDVIKGDATIPFMQDDHYVQMQTQMVNLVIIL